MLNSFRNWLDAQIETNSIKYFNYEDFSDLKIVGKGGNGIVCRANWKSHGMTVALKVLKINLLVDESIWEEFVKELILLQKVFYHPNINQFLGITTDPKFGYAMVLQYANGGNLRDYLANSKIPLSWSDNYRIALEIANGLLCLHAEDIVHRDLHSKNILVHQDRMLIADFGLSKEESSITSEFILIGIAAYIDPQYYKQEGYKGTKPSDIFSLGVILWEISSRSVPFSELPELIVTANLMAGDREKPVEGTPEKYFELYTKCWDDDPSNRPTIADVVSALENNPFILSTDNFIIVEAMWDFNGNKRDGELKFYRGDILEVIEYVNDKWWRGRIKDTNEIGIFPKWRVKILSEDNLDGQDTSEQPDSAYLSQQIETQYSSSKLSDSSQTISIPSVTFFPIQEDLQENQLPFTQPLQITN